MSVRLMLKHAAIATAVAIPAVVGAQTPSATQPAPALVEIKDLIPREYVSAGFVLASPQSLRVEAVGAEPATEYRGNRPGDEHGWYGPEDERDTWPAVCWIVNVRTGQ